MDLWARPYVETRPNRWGGNIVHDGRRMPVWIQLAGAAGRNRRLIVGVLCAVMLYYRLQGLAQGRRRHPGLTVDMHSHTTESDGDKSAEEQIALAQQRGVTELWITDHDLVRTPRRTHVLRAFAAEVGVHLGLGVEITVPRPSRSLQSALLLPPTSPGARTPRLSQMLGTACALCRQVSWLKKEHHLLGYLPDTSWGSDVDGPCLPWLAAEPPAPAGACAALHYLRRGATGLDLTSFPTSHMCVARPVPGRLWQA